MNLSRVGRLGSNCGNRNRFSRRKNSAPETAGGQHQTAVEIFCDLAELPSQFFIVREGLTDTRPTRLSGARATDMNRPTPEFFAALSREGAEPGAQIAGAGTTELLPL
jgi:hypothetical protein